MSGIDWCVVGLYLAGVGVIGFAFAGKQRSTKDYFLGGRSLPWWAATLSIVATETSAVTFIGVPRGAFDGDWSILQLFFGFALGRVFLAFVFVRVFYRREYLTVYGFLADRFGGKSRATAALLFLLGRVVASGVRLFAGCLAIQAATDLSIEAAIVGLGLFGTLFTLTGGIRAVVWTDVILGLTFVASALVAAAFLLAALPGGLEGLLTDETFADRTRIFHFDWSWTRKNTFVAGLVGGFVLTLATHGTDQDIAQRMLTCRDAKNGTWSVLGSALLILPLITLFLAVGTLLHFFHEKGAPSYELPADLNHLFPTYIVSELPLGVAGLVMAGIFAAALSSFTSALNALAATSIGDFYKPLTSRLRRWPPNPSESHFVTASRVATALWGGLLILTALAFVGGRENILGLALRVLTYFYGGILGAFLLGMLTRRGTDGTTFCGMLTAVPMVLLLQLREYVADASKAPGWIQGLVDELSPQTKGRILEIVPAIAWPYWIVIATVVSVAIGACRSNRAHVPPAEDPRTG